LPSQLLNKQGFTLVVPLKAFDILCGGSNCGGFGPTLQWFFCVLNVDLDATWTFCLPARDLGSEIVKLGLEFVAVAALNEVVRSPG
jgi:hypothetical protein